MLRTVDAGRRHRRAGPRRQRRAARLPHRGRAGRAVAAALEALLRRRPRHRGRGCSCRCASSAAGVRPPTSPTAALNEAVLEKTPMGHTVRLGVQHRRRLLHDLRRRRADRGHAHRLDRLLVLGPGPDRRPRRYRACCSRRCRPTCSSTARSCSTPDLEVRLEVLGHRPATLSVDGRNVGVLLAGRRGRLHGVADRRPGSSPSAPATSTGSSRPSSACRTGDRLMLVELRVRDLGVIAEPRSSWCRRA